MHLGGPPLGVLGLLAFSSHVSVVHQQTLSNLPTLQFIIPSQICCAFYLFSAVYWQPLLLSCLLQVHVACQLQRNLSKLLCIVYYMIGSILV